MPIFGVYPISYVALLAAHLYNCSNSYIADVAQQIPHFTHGASPALFGFHLRRSWCSRPHRPVHFILFGPLSLSLHPQAPLLLVDVIVFVIFKILLHNYTPSGRTVLNLVEQHKIIVHVMLFSALVRFHVALSLHDTSVIVQTISLTARPSTAVAAVWTTAPLWNWEYLYSCNLSLFDSQIGFYRSGENIGLITNRPANFVDKAKWGTITPASALCFRKPQSFSKCIQHVSHHNYMVSSCPSPTIRIVQEAKPMHTNVIGTSCPCPLK